MTTNFLFEEECYCRQLYFICLHFTHIISSNQPKIFILTHLHCNDPDDHTRALIGVGGQTTPCAHFYDPLRIVLTPPEHININQKYIDVILPTCLDVY